VIESDDESEDDECTTIDEKVKKIKKQKGKEEKKKKTGRGRGERGVIEREGRERGAECFYFIC